MSISVVLLRGSAACLALLAATCGTPLLPGVIQTVIHYQFFDPMVASAAIAEMQPFYRGTMGIISATIVIVIAAFAILRRNQLPPRDWLMLAVSTALPSDLKRR